mmetsp:Transcript_51516/g.92544  ORF Transcript_51516/g.92544 Transcript_51516/m.92544 type:complete len:343 (-) Transcript_51516:171-1199(-)
MSFNFSSAMVKPYSAVTYALISSSLRSSSESLSYCLKMPTCFSASFFAASFLASLSTRCCALDFKVLTLFKDSSTVALSSLPLPVSFVAVLLVSSDVPRIRVTLLSIRVVQRATACTAAMPTFSNSVLTRINSWSAAPPPASGPDLASVVALCAAESTATCISFIVSACVSAASSKDSSSTCRVFAATSSLAGLTLIRTFVLVLSHVAFDPWILLSRAAQADIVSSAVPFSFMCLPSMKSKQPFTALVAPEPATSNSSAIVINSSVVSPAGSSADAAASAFFTSASATSTSLASSSCKVLASLSASSLSFLISSSFIACFSACSFLYCSSCAFRRSISSCFF